MRALKRAALVAALLFPLACSDSGPTAIELPIATIVVTQGCPTLIVGQQCRPTVEARTAEGQLVVNPILRWTSSNPGTASVTDQGLIQARGPGEATIRVSNSTDSARADIFFRVIDTNPK